MNIDLEIHGHPVLVRGRSSDLAVYIGQTDGWLYLAGQIEGKDWIATVHGRVAKGTATSVQAAAKAIAAFWWKHRNDDVLFVNDRTRLNSPGGPVPPSDWNDGLCRPRLKPEDMEMIRHWSDSLCMKSTG